ncbi:hypothetical protein HPB50_014735 [Hyalomma asiaticum]|uniref:Uncharacterized protein n=1 Tax=Hyalomma asiaticum TaxID=266040 RepID=A0ACB7S9I5_HYAAI|nr:hypothetical protein HPB50_014735 [Hyalomma asiaticum]
MSGVYIKKHEDDVFDTSEGALPYKLQRIAEDELGETPARRQEALDKLAALLSEELQQSLISFPKLKFQ